jgi:hypothetical protein
MRSELRLSAELHSARLRSLAAFASAGLDELALKLCQPSEDSQHQPSMWSGRIAPLIGQRPEARTRLANCIEDVE